VLGHGVKHEGIIRIRGMAKREKTLRGSRHEVEASAGPSRRNGPGRQVRGVALGRRWS
jgi:hypothetical protein